MHQIFSNIGLFKSYQFFLFFATCIFTSQAIADQFDESKTKILASQEKKKTKNPNLAKQIEEWKIVLKFDPSNSGFNYQLAELLIRDENYPEAEYYLKKALESRSDNVDALLRLSYLYLWEGKYDLAEEGFKQILKTNPKYLDAKVGLSRTERQRAAFEEELKEKESLAKPAAGPKMKEETLEDLIELVKVEPEVADYQYRLGTLYVKNKQYEEAKVHLQKALELNPKEADALLRLSYIYLWEDEPQKAMDGFEKVLKDHPDYVDAKKGLARAQTKLKEIEEEAKEKEQLTAKPTTEPRQETVEELLNLIKEHPNIAEYQYRLGTLYVTNKQYDKAKIHLQKALELDPKEVDALLRLSYIHLWEGETRKAIDGFERVLKIRSDYTDAQEGLATAQKQLKEKESIEKERLSKLPSPEEQDYTLDKLLELVEEHPNSAGYQYLLGTLYVKEKKYDEAKKHLEKALELDPKQSDALLRLSYLYLWDKDTKKAIEGFEKILKDHPDYTDAATGLKSAQELQAALEKPPKKERSREEQARIDHALEMEKKQLLGEAFSFWYGLYLDYPGDPEYTYNTGKVASWIGKWNLGKKLLCDSMDQSAYRADALIWLGNIYRLLGKWPPAYTTFCLVTREYPKRGEGWLGLARLQFKTRKFKRAVKSYRKAYRYIDDAMDKAIVRRELVDTRIIADPSLRFTERYGQELEKDLQTKLEAARRYTWLNEARYQCPITEKLIAYQDLCAGYEREKNLAANLNNFYVHTYHATTGIDFFYNPYYKFSVGCTVRKGINQGEPIFPFRNRVVGEPWVGVDYRTVKKIITCGFLRDSFIYKNFQKNYSAFLLRNTVEASYQYQNFPFGQYIGISGYYRKYKDNIRNDERRARIWMQSAFPRFQENWVLRYEFQIGGFRRTDTDYYSFKSQWEHLAKIYYWNSWTWLDYAEIGYQRSWRSSRDLNQPINTAFFLPKQFIFTNRVTLVLRKILKEGMESNLEGLYYWDTAGYKAIAFKADVRWIF